jgi:hypothetical protein
MCHRAYACTPAAMQDASFHSAWGPSEATCSAGLAQLCDQGCAGKQVDVNAKNTCFNDVNTQSCSTVCVDAPTGGGGGGGTSTGGSISDPIVFCKMALNAVCDRAFQCVPVALRDVDFTDNYGTSLSDCKTIVNAACVDPATNCPTYNAATGASCVATLTNDTCAALLFQNQIVPPGTCSAACGM